MKASASRVGATVMCVVSVLACAPRQRPRDLTSDRLTKALDALERKVCLTVGDKTNGPTDRCEPQVDRQTYLEPLRDVFVAAPPILRAYLCSMDRLYFDYHSVWNASFSIQPDSLTKREYRSISVRRGILENKVRYSDWATAWTQHWWTGGPNDKPRADSALPRVEIESELAGPSGALYHLLAHEVGHALDYDNRRGLRRADAKAFEPGEFGYLGWISPSYVDTANVVHRAVARESAFEEVRTIDFDGAVTARLAMLDSTEKIGRTFDAGAVAVQNWQPADRNGIATFLDRLDRSSFTTVFSTWRPEDDWTESFAVMMLPAIAQKYDIVIPGRARVQVLKKVLDDTSPFAPKRRFIQQVVDRALTDFRAHQAVSPNPCFSAALAK